MMDDLDYTRFSRDQLNGLFRHCCDQINYFQNKTERNPDTVSYVLAVFAKAKVLIVYELERRDEYERDHDKKATGRDVQF